MHARHYRTLAPGASAFRWLQEDRRRRGADSAKRIAQPRLHCIHRRICQMIKLNRGMGIDRCVDFVI